MRSYELPEEKTKVVGFVDTDSSVIEDLDLTQFTNEEQALMIARFALARRFTDHSIEFQATLRLLALSLVVTSA